jgi:hypothetical protein
MSTLDDIRKNLKAGKTAPRVSNVTSLAKPGTLDAIRAQIKAGKIKTAPKPAPAPVGIRGVPLR